MRPVLAQVDEPRGRVGLKGGEVVAGDLAVPELLRSRGEVDAELLGRRLRREVLRLRRFGLLPVVGPLLVAHAPRLA